MNICIFFLQEQWQSAQNSTLFISFFDRQTFYQHSLRSSSLQVKKDWKKKELWMVLSFHFLLCHYIQHRWLANVGEQHTTAASLHPQQVLSPWKWASQQASKPPSPLDLLSLRGNRLTCTGFGPHWTASHHGSFGILCSWGITNTTCEWGRHSYWMYLLCSRSCSIVLLDFISKT